VSGKKDESHFDLIWQEKIKTGDSTSIYQAGDNLRIDETLKILEPGERFLDIGCGTGILAEQLKGRYQQLYGIDIASPAVEIAIRKGIQAAVLNLNESPLPFESGSIDTITMLSTLQYFYDLDFVCAEVCRVLKPSGVFILSVPNMRAFWRVVKIAIQGRFPKVSKDTFGYDGGTLHYFCYQDVLDLLKPYRLKEVWSKGIFCLPKFINHFEAGGLFGKLKMEFFSAEFLVKAVKQ
jgi:methionine biosynthesis protein MetW